MTKFQSDWGNYLLTELVETPAPEAIDYWPHTLGWQLLAIILIFYLLYRVGRYWRRYKHNRYRRDALVWLAKLPPFSDIEQQSVYRQLPAVLRKVAITSFKRQDVCLLQQQDWELWLDKQGVDTSFSCRFKSYLHQFAYAPEVNFSSGDVTLFVAECRKWIIGHRRQDD